VASRALSLLAQGCPEVWSSTFFILREFDQRIVGSCGFKNVPKLGRVEVGYGISPSARGQGAATAAVRLLVAQALNAGAQEVLAEVSPNNPASLRVVQKAGFTEVGSRLDESNEYVLQWLLRFDT
jgi:RimJ/RimL family protein N-acetyltransferase